MRETVIQFGEGNFLRGFVDSFLDTMNKQGIYDGKAVIIQPRAGGKVALLDEQDCKYNLYLRGIEKGETVEKRQLIESVSRGIDPYKNFDEYISLAHNPDFRFIVSNTTEAGIEFDESCSFEDKPCKSFPGKLTQLLYERFRIGHKGFVFLPCELIDRNGDELKRCVLKYCEKWNLPDEFTAWIETENCFCNTLVDRIVSGFPADEAEEIFEKIGMRDAYLNTAEPYELWVIEENFEEELPLEKAGVNVIWTDDVSPYKKLKVRLLNGAHTSIVCAGLIAGKQTVRDCLEDATVSAYLKKCLYDEIIFALGENEENKAFADSVVERFSNPYIRHLLRSISLNSVSKFRVRVLPSIIDYREKTGNNPDCISAALGFLIHYYKSFTPDDDESVIDFIRNNDIKEILKNSELWGEDISFLYGNVISCLESIEDKGIEKTLKLLTCN